MSLVEAVLVWQGGTGVGEHRQVHTGTQTGTETKTDRDTHSVYVLYDVLEGGVGPEGGQEAAPVQV